MPIEIRRKDLKTLVSQGRAQLVEVLPASEYKKEHLPHAINIPLTDLDSETARQLKKETAVIVYCADFRCDLSARAAWRLESMGFQEVYRYTAGKADWLAAGFETEGTEASKSRIKQALSEKVQTCSLRDRMQEVQNLRGSNDICVVLNDRNIVMGVIRDGSWNADPLTRVSQAMEAGPKTFRPDEDPKEMQKELRRLELEAALITTSDGEFLGVVRRSDKRDQRKAA